jgi:hypothetical protein
MDVYDRTASDSEEDLARFWTDVDLILQVDDGQDERQEGGSNGSKPVVPEVDAFLLQSRLTSFLELCDACYGKFFFSTSEREKKAEAESPLTNFPDTYQPSSVPVDMYLDQSENCDEVLSRLLESPLFTQASNVDISNVLITLVTSAKKLTMLHLIFDTLLRLGSQDAEVYRSRLAVTQLIPRLVHHFWAARYAEEYIVRVVGKKEKNGEEADHSLDWNLKQIRNVSNGIKEKQQARDRILQCKLRDESVVLLYEVCRAQRLELSDMRECKEWKQSVWQS